MTNNTAFYPDGTPFSGDDTIELVKQHNPTDTVLLSFSRGKDSVCSLIKLREHFNVIPVYLYFVPGLSFVEESLTWYENHFNLKILRLASPGFYRMMNNFIYQPPERVAAIRALKLPMLEHDDITAIVKAENDLPGDNWSATGVRAFDNLRRRTTVTKNGPVNWARHQFMPIWDMNIQAVDDMLTEHQIRLPMDYVMFGRSFDGLMYRFIKPIKDRYPDDYKIILEWYPLVEAEIFRYEQVGQ
jgi:hypothetical protein